MKNIRLLFDFLLFPLFFLYRLAFGGRRQRVDKKGYHYHLTSLSLILLFGSTLSLQAASNSCPGINEGSIASGSTVSYTDFINKKTQKNRYHYIDIPGPGVVNISIDDTNNKNYQINVGTSCGGTQIGGPKKSKDPVTYPYTVTSSTGERIFISHDSSYFGNNADHEFKVTISFAADVSANYSCSKPHQFELRKSLVLAGDLVAIGNSNICADDDKDGICDDDQRKRNDTNNIIFINSASSSPMSEENSSLENISTAHLNLPQGAEVVWAGLYWQGEVWDFNTANTATNRYGVDIENGAKGTKRQNNANSIKLRVPGGVLQDVEGDKHYYVFLKRSHPTGSSTYPYGSMTRYEEHYQSFKDVTSLLQSVENAYGSADGNYTVANIQATPGRLKYPGVEAAWSLQVVYKVPGSMVRSVAINDGYVALYDSASQGDDYAKAVGCPTGAQNTGVYGREISFDVGGFLTPKESGFYTDLTLFITESDPEASSTDEKLTVTKKDATRYMVDGPNAWNYEITDKNGTDNLDRTPNYIYPIGMTIKNYHQQDMLDTNQYTTNIKFQTDSDRLLLGVIGFATDLRVPKLCYDYSYAQNGRYFTEENDGSKDPRIEGNLFSSAPVDVGIFLRNEENSDVTIKNLTMDIAPIMTSEATYISGSAEVTKPGQTRRQNATISSSGPGGVYGIQVGDIGSKESFYTYYSLDPAKNDISMPINASVDFNTSITVPNVGTFEWPYSLTLSSEIPLCADENFSYAPVYGAFNVEHKGLNKYNLHTQVARRVDNFEVKAYDANNPNTSVNVTTVVGVELIDAGSYHETQTACNEPDAALTPRVWVTFDNNVSHTDFTFDTLNDAITNRLVSDQILNQTEKMDEPEDYYSKARRNTAFRISGNRLGAGDELVHLLPGTCVGQQVPPCYEVDNFPDLNKLDVGHGAGNCGADVDGNPSSTDKIPQYCGNAGKAGLDKAQLAVCMECIYGYNTFYTCSRDNFAIRPEAFKVSLTDDNTSTVVTDFANNTGKSGSSGSPINLVAGYPYRFDINATSHTDEAGVEGYIQKFDSKDPLKRTYMEWKPSAGQVVSNCNEPDDRNMSFSLVNGTNTNANPINTWDDKHDTLDNVGEYEFKIDDEEWTKYDWDENLTKHHTVPHFISSNTADCVENSTVVPDVGSGLVGCKTSSVHDTTYKAVSIRSYPYKFGVDSLTIGARPNNDSASNTFIYINTLDISTYLNATADENMSYNVQGTFSAKSFDDKSLSNFVNNCYAEDVDMKLLYNYNYPGDPQLASNNLAYNLFDYNVTGYTRVNSNLPSDSIITQTASNFSKDMNGSIRMDLGFNYPRTYNTPVNPIYVSMNDFNVSYSTQPTSLQAEGKSNHKIYGNKDLDQNVTFVYGRAKPQQYFYDSITANSVITPVSVTAYCDLGLIECQNRRMDTLANGLLIDAQSNEADWWFVEKHDSSTGDGNITLTTTTTNATVSLADPTPISLTNGIDSTVTVGYTGASRPQTVNINFGTGTDRWLIYNKDANSIPLPFYRVRFINVGNWAGEGKTGNVVGGNINKKKTRRLEW